MKMLPDIPESNFGLLWLGLILFFIGLVIFIGALN